MKNKEIYEKGLLVLLAVAREKEKTHADVQLLTANLYDSMEEISSAELFKQGRYIKWDRAIESALVRMATTEEKLLADSFASTYVLANPYNTPISKEIVEQALKREWQGRTFSQSVWRNTEELKKQLEKQILHNISSGQSRQKFAKEISERFDVNMSKANTLVRTETQYFLNQGQADRYKERGVERYQFSAADDERTSEECEEKNEEIFYFSEMETGVNFPPLHPNCRSTIVPVIEG